MTVSAACTATPSSALPLLPATPLGTSIATTGRALLFKASTSSRAAPSSGLESPAPNSASTISSDPSSSAGDSGRHSPFHFSAMAPASPLPRASQATCTAKPLSRSSRATTKPSPPLLPGRTTPGVRQGAKRAVMASATARPAFSIKLREATPDATAKASARDICSVVRISPLMVTGSQNRFSAAPVLLPPAPAVCRKQSAHRCRACRF